MWTNCSLKTLCGMRWAMKVRTMSCSAAMYALSSPVIMRAGLIVRVVHGQETTGDSDPYKVLLNPMKNFDFACSFWLQNMLPLSRRSTYFSSNTKYIVYQLVFCSEGLRPRDADVWPCAPSDGEWAARSSVDDGECTAPVCVLCQTSCLVHCRDYISQAHITWVLLVHPCRESRWTRERKGRATCWS